MKIPHISILGLIVLIATATVRGQSAPSSKPTPNTDEVVTLSQFTVGANTERGYLASETVSGSRVATSIKDLPYNVNVVTSEFLEDFGAFEGTTNAFAYTSSVSAVDISGSGNSTIRGFASQYMLRDGFFRLGRTDPMLIDRVEFIKGPNVASIYGETQPGGIANMITKRPTTRTKGNLSLTSGSYDTSKVQLTATGPMSASARTLYFVGFSDFQRGYEVEGAALHNRSGAVGIEQKFADGGDLYVLASTYRNQAHSVISSVPYFYDSVTKTYTDIDMDLAALNQNGPHSETTREAHDATATFEKKINDVFSFRSAANWWRSHKWLFNAGSGTQYDYRANVLAKGTPAKNLINEDGGGFQADLVAHYKLFDGRTDNKTLLTFDFSDYYRWDRTWSLNSNLIIANTATRIPPGPEGSYWFKNIYPGQPIDYSVPDYSPANFSIPSGHKKNRSSIFGGLLRHQLSLYDNRLMLFGTLRYDVVNFLLRNTDGAGAYAKGSATAWSPSLGLNYKVNQRISAYVSRGVGFNANAQNQAATNTPSIQPNQRSWGYDYGLKFSLLEDRLFFTVAGYYIVLRNVPTTELLPNGTTATNFTGSQLARGAELDLTWRVTNDFTLVGGYGHNNTIYTYFGRDTGAVGFSPRRVPHDQGGLAGKYGFRGALKGLSINAGVTYVGRQAAENPNTGDLFNSAGVYTGNDGRRYLQLPSYSLLNFNVHYRFGADRTSGIRQTVSIFGKNLTDRRFIEYLTSQATASDRRTIYITYSVGY